MLEVNVEKLKTANERVSQGGLSYKTILLEVVPEILDLDIREVSGTELVGKNYYLYTLVKKEYAEEYPALLSALALSVPYERQ
jgi:hypothetical protein